MFGGKVNPVTQLTRQLNQPSIQQQHGFVSQEGPSSLRSQAGPSQMEQEFFRRESQLLPPKPVVTELQAPEHYQAQSWASEYEREGGDIMVSYIRNNKRNWLDPVIEMYNSGIPITINAVIEAIYSDRPWNIKAAVLISNGNFSDNDYALFMGAAVSSNNIELISTIANLKQLTLEEILHHVTDYNTDALHELLTYYPYDNNVYFELLSKKKNPNTVIYILQNIPINRLNPTLSTSIRQLLVNTKIPSAQYWYKRLNGYNPSTVEALHWGDFMAIIDNDDALAFEKVMCFFNNNNRRYDLLRPLLNEVNFTYEEKQQIYQWLISKGAPFELFLDFRPSFGFNPFDFVNERTNLQIVEFLLSKPYNPALLHNMISSAIATNNQEILHIAFQHGYKPTSEDLTNAITSYSLGVLNEITAFEIGTPRHVIDAIKVNNLPAIKDLLVTTPTIAITEEMINLSRPHPAMYKYLLSIYEKERQYSDVRTAINNGTPINIENIMAAIVSGQQEIALLLLKSVVLTDQQAADLIVTAYNTTGIFLVTTNDILHMGYRPNLRDFVYRINDLSKVNIKYILGLYDIDPEVYQYILERTTSLDLIKFILSNGIYPIGSNRDRIINILQSSDTPARIKQTRSAGRRLSESRYWIDILTGRPVNMSNAVANNDIVTVYTLNQQGVPLLLNTFQKLLYTTRRFDIVEKFIPFIIDGITTYKELIGNNAPVALLEQIEHKFSINNPSIYISGRTNSDIVEYIARSRCLINEHSDVMYNVSTLRILLEHDKIQITTKNIENAVSGDNMAILQQLLTYGPQHASSKSVNIAIQRNDLPALRMLLTARPDLIIPVSDNMSPEIKDYITKLLTPVQTAITPELIQQSQRWLQYYDRFIKKPTPQVATNLVTMLKAISTLIIPFTTDLPKVPPEYHELSDILGRKSKMYSGAKL